MFLNFNIWKPQPAQNLVINLFENEEPDGINLFVFDTETTGLDKKENRIIQFSALLLNIKKDEIKVVKRYNHYFDPGVPVPEKITELTGITQEMVDGKPNDDEAYKIVSEIFGGNPVVCAHNLPFDYAFVNELYKRHGDEFKPSKSIDTLSIARSLFAKEEVGSHKLGALGAYLHVDKDVSFHCADDDTVVCGRILIKFYKILKSLRDKMYAKPVPEKISFKEWTKCPGGWRVYANTNLGNMYFDSTDGFWHGCDAVLDQINMEKIHEMALKSSKRLEGFYSWVGAV